MTVTLRDAHGTLLSQTFQRDFLVIGDVLTEQLFDDYVGSQDLDANVLPMAHAIPHSETGGTLQHFHPVAGSNASRRGYPARDPLNGYGLFALTAGPPTREQIWNWKRNTDEGLVRIRAALDYARNYLAGYPYTAEQLRLEAYARYNGGFYHVLQNNHWVRDPAYVCGCARPGGSFSWRLGMEASGAGTCRPLAQCYADVTRTFE